MEGQSLAGRVYPDAKKSASGRFRPSIGFQEIDRQDGHIFYELPLALPKLEPITYIAIEE